MARVTVGVRARRPLRDRLGSLIGVTVESTADSYCIVRGAPTAQTIVVGLISVWLGLHLVVYLGALAKFPYWGPFSTIDEQLQYYQVARNYTTYGFFSSAMLPDLSTASSLVGHPYLYNHQPPGPQLFIGMLMRLFGENFRMIRLVFALIFVLGLLCYVRFVRQLDPEYAYAALGVLIFIPPQIMLHAVDHPGKSVFAFAAFFPIIALHRCRETSGRGWLVAAALVVFLSSNYLMYSHLFMILAFWTLGMLLRFIAIKPRELTLFFVLAGVGIVLHLLQTILVLGWSPFVWELTATLSNRMVGVPTRQEMADFFLKHSIVLYGGHAFELRRFLKTIWRELSFPAREVWIPAVTIILVAGIGFAVRTTERTIIVGKPLVQWLKALGLAAAWIGVSVVIPVFMFPAFASDYSLAGAREFLTALFVVLSVCATARFIQRLPSPEAAGTMLAVVLLAFLLGVGIVQAGQAAGTVAPRIAAWVTTGSPHAALARVGDALSGRVTMTNVDPTVVGFFTRETVYGGCHGEALGVDAIDTSACRVSFVRRYPPREQPRPSAYVWVGGMQSFCDEHRDCIDRASLDRRYTKMFESGLVAAYDLTKPL